MKWFSILLVLITLSACESFAVFTTPLKQAQQNSSPLAKEASEAFLTALHQGRYQDLEKVNVLLMRAYLENPFDPKLAGYLGFLHLWILTERQRLPSVSPMITDQVILAKKYFSDALLLDPANPIYLGFFSDSQLVEGQIFKDKRQEIKAYFNLKKAIRAWPEFNYFTAGYPMSTLPFDSEHFKEGLEWQWQTLDLCAGEKINRQEPYFNSYMSKETLSGRKRACWNSWIAPHNFEGFFMNMGDMLVKAGDWQRGLIIYQNAKLSRHYSSWSFKQLLESRIKNAKENSDNFKKNLSGPERAILFNSGYGCVVCHQR